MNAYRLVTYLMLHLLLHWDHFLLIYIFYNQECMILSHHRITIFMLLFPFVLHSILQAYWRKWGERRNIFRILRLLFSIMNLIVVVISFAIYAVFHMKFVIVSCNFFTSFSDLGATSG